MSLDDYKLRCELIGHSGDVRDIACARTGEIISVSRDCSSKVWRPEGNQYVEGITMRDHLKFVISVCIVEKENWICTGSNDCNISVYKFGELNPFLTVKGHTDSVCSLASAHKEKSIVSGSWDHSAKLWTLSETGYNCITFNGHEQAVWSVIPLQDGNYASGSADRKIGIWNSMGTRLMTLTGHADCVRTVIQLPDGRLLSSSNDASIRLWSTPQYECLREFHGHTNYIFTMSLVPALGDDVFVTGGEDSTIRLWNTKDGQLGKPMAVPTQSVWVVRSLPNGDLVAGTSDSAVRVFTRNEENFAGEQLIKSYESAAEIFKAKNEEQIGGVKKKDIPGPESLIERGTKNGQSKMVRQPNGQIWCYQWDGKEWIGMGEVTGGTGGSTITSGRQLYMGKEYDYVFSIDVEDGKPALKLPYNLGEDPWLKAQEFIHAHSLPQVYLEQVANFVITNSQTGDLQAVSSSGYSDPFTGGNRYVPGSSNTGGAGSGNVDPFTGGSSYHSGANGTSTAAPGNPPTGSAGVNMDPITGGSSYTTAAGAEVAKRLFPLKTYIYIETYDAAKILMKLKEFNIKVPDEVKMTAEQLTAVVDMISQPVNQIDPNAVRALKQMYSWPSDELFPVLDVTRLVVRDEKKCELIGNFELLEMIISNLSIDVPAPNRLMVIRCLANMISHKWGRGLFEAKFEEIFTAIDILTTGNAMLQQAISTLLFNVSVALVDVSNENMCRIVTNSCIHFMLWSNAVDAQLRCAQTFGNLLKTVYKNNSVVTIVSAGLLTDKMRELQKDIEQPQLRDTIAAVFNMLESD